MATRGRILLDGSIVYPKRGDPPALIDGYERDTKNDYVLKPILKECAHRKLVHIPTPCGKTTPRLKCAKRDKYVLPSDCMVCND